MNAAPRISLGTLFMAAQFIDLLWPTLLLLDIEHVEIAPGTTAVTPLDFTDYPITHSLLMVCVWGILFGQIYWLVRKSVKGSLVLGLAVVSHWLLDLIVHRPDLPIYPGNAPHVGLDLWNSVIGTLIVEGIIFVAGVILYTRTTQARNRVGSLGFLGLVIFLVLIHLGNLFGPPPPSVEAIAWAGQLQWLFVIRAYWVDRNRTVYAKAEDGNLQHGALTPS